MIQSYRKTCRLSGMQLVVGKEMQLSRERSQEVKMNKSRVGRMTQTVVHEPQPRNSFPGKNLVRSITFNCTEQNKKEKKNHLWWHLTTTWHCSTYCWLPPWVVCVAAATRQSRTVMQNKKQRSEQWRQKQTAAIKLCACVTASLIILHTHTYDRIERECLMFIFRFCQRGLK